MQAQVLLRLHRENWAIETYARCIQGVRTGEALRARVLDLATNDKFNASMLMSFYYKMRVDTHFV